MSYLIKNATSFVSIKLTEKGREQLAQGKLNFSYWGIGDSEINYNRETIVDAAIVAGTATLTGSSRIMRPVDRQPNIKAFISKEGATTPYQTLGTNNLSVIKAVVNNEADERGFFSVSGSVYTTLSNTIYSPYYEVIANSVLTGGTQINLTYTSAITVGDVVLLKLANDTSGTIVQDENTRPLPNLWYKIKSIIQVSVSNTVITVDRNLPNLSSQGANSQILIYRGGEVYETIATGNTTSYWDTGTLSFDSSNNITCHDVPVWNMNNVWCETLAGTTGTTYEDYTKYGSYEYLGAKNPFFEYLCQTTATTASFSCNGPGTSFSDDVSKSISIIHYTNNTISNLYGEFLYVDALNSKIVKIYLPDLMYHRRDYSTASGTTMGMRFIATGATKYVGTSDLEYIDLIEDPSLISSATTAQAIGRVYPQLKTIVIHDDEIVAAISYKSNRNWTLPTLSATLASPSGGTSTGVLPVNQTIYLTYSLENTGATGLTSSINCQNFVKLINETNMPKDVMFKINETDFLPYMRKKETNYDGYGFYADKFKLLYQIVSDPSIRPDPAAWKSYDFTSTAITTGAGETIDPKLLETQNPTALGFTLDILKDATSSTFSLIELLNMAPNVSPDELQFGDERFFYGNLNTFIGASIYKTIFQLQISASNFNTTTNPTRNNTSLSAPNIKVSEVGVYDSDKNLVCVGKLSSPIAIKNSTITLELSIDF